MRKLLARLGITKPSPKEAEGKKEDVEDYFLSDSTETVIVDIGAAYTKYGFVSSKEPRCFPSVITQNSCLVHLGSYVGETIGRERVGDGLPGTRYSTVKEGWDYWTDPTEINHFAVYAIMKCLRKQVTEEDYDNELYSRNAVRIIAPNVKPEQLNEPRIPHATPLWYEPMILYNTCIENSQIKSGIIVDLGHLNIFMHVVYDHKIVHTESLGFGGNSIISCFSNMVRANNPSLFYLYEYEFRQELEKYCFVTVNMRKSLQEHGYRFKWDWTDSKMKDTYLDLLPEDLLNQVFKCVAYSADTNTADIYEKMGIIKVKPVTETVMFRQNKVEIGVERVLATEILFQPEPHTKKLHTTLRKLVQQYYDEGANNIVLCGGLTRLPGLTERLRLELNDLKVNISVDEHLIWKGACAHARSTKEQ